MKRVLITGGLGFLGSYSIEKWEKMGWDITIIDSYHTRYIRL